MIATTPVDPKYKARWLHGWNSNNTSQHSLCFPVGDVKETDLETWVFWASFWAHAISFIFFLVVSDASLNLKQVTVF